MKKVTVVAAVIQDHDNFLCVQRGPNKYPYISKKWEFPGGKIEANETEQEALIRELKEELHLDLTVNEKLITVNHDYNDFSLTMHTYLCSTPMIYRSFQGKATVKACDS